MCGLCLLYVTYLKQRILHAINCYRTIKHLKKIIAKGKYSRENHGHTRKKPATSYILYLLFILNENLSAGMHKCHVHEMEYISVYVQHVLQILNYNSILSEFEI